MHRFAPSTLIVAAAISLSATPLAAQRAGAEWPQHSMERPQPPVEQAPRQQLPVPPPPGAVVLFDGSDLSAWQDSRGRPAAWRLTGDGAMEMFRGAGGIETRAGFGDVMLHVEWATPTEIRGAGQGRGNSGVYLMQTYELQVLDSYQNVTYPDGHAGAIYGQFPPRVNVSRAPGEWQSFDIEFRRPKFAEDGRLVTPARMTVRHNGVLIHDDVALLGPTSHTTREPYVKHADALPISLQDHGDLVRYRNIWVVPLAPAPAPESIWYIRNDEEGIRSFVANARHISVIAPQTYSIDSAGTIRGGMDPRIVAAARANGVKLVPLVMNPGFDLGILHHVVTDRGARTASARSMADLCRREGLHGIQLDMENLHVSDRDAFTAFAREAADSVHAAGCELSAAVVPRTSDDRGETPYHHWMYDYWRGAYDYVALTESLDFISYMTYAQHTGGSTPGPVAGFPWMVASLEYVLALGVPPEKISLGVPAYSDYWYARYDPATGQSRTVVTPQLSFPCIRTISARMRA